MCSPGHHRWLRRASLPPAAARAPDPRPARRGVCRRRAAPWSAPSPASNSSCAARSCLASRSVVPQCRAAAHPLAAWSCGRERHGHVCPDLEAAHPDVREYTADQPRCRRRTALLRERLNDRRPRHPPRTPFQPACTAATARVIGSAEQDRHAVCGADADAGTARAGDQAVGPASARTPRLRSHRDRPPATRTALP